MSSISDTAVISTPVSSIGDTAVISTPDTSKS